MWRVFFWGAFLTLLTIQCVAAEPPVKAPQLAKAYVVEKPGSLQVVVEDWCYPAPHEQKRVHVDLNKLCEDQTRLAKGIKPKTIIQAVAEEGVLFLIGALVQIERQKAVKFQIITRVPGHLNPDNKKLKNMVILQCQSGLKGPDDINITNITKRVCEQWGRYEEVKPIPQKLCEWALGLQVAQRVYESSLME